MERMGERGVVGWMEEEEERGGLKDGRGRGAGALRTNVE